MFTPLSVTETESFVHSKPLSIFESEHPPPWENQNSAPFSCVKSMREGKYRNTLCSDAGKGGEYCREKFPSHSFPKGAEGKKNLARFHECILTIIYT